MAELKSLVFLLGIFGFAIGLTVAIGGKDVPVFPIYVRVLIGMGSAIFLAFGWFWFFGALRLRK